MSTQKLGRYDLIRVIGKGAMGVVYEGRDPNLDRRVAIKTILVDNLSAEAVADYEVRFKTEAKSAARLQHPNIVSVYDSDRDGNVAFLVMEFIQGEDLKHHLDRGVRFQLDQSIAIVRDLLSALDYAHRQNVIHRDVKPANLLLEPNGRVKLTDFGVARIQDSNEATRTQGSIVGTLKYMAPEQVQGHAVDARTDLFAAGVVLYQLLTGRRPFDDDNDFAIMHQIIGKTPEPPSNVNPLLPKTLDAVIAKALSKSRDERFATARDFALALQSACRRATDTSVVPPVTTESGSGGSQPGLSPRPSGTDVNTLMGGTSPSTVTQEVELVYWKDIKDTTDVDDLEGFLARFPTGIYADLARRRIRKLSGLSTEGTLSGTTSYRTEGTQTELAPGAVRLGDGASLGSVSDSATLVVPVTLSSPTESDFDPLATVKIMSDDQDATMHMPVPALDVQSVVAPMPPPSPDTRQTESTSPTIKLAPKPALQLESEQQAVQPPQLDAPPTKPKSKSNAMFAALAVAALLVVGLGTKALWPTREPVPLPPEKAVEKPASFESITPSQASSTTPASSPQATAVAQTVTAASAPLSSSSKPAPKSVAIDKARIAETSAKIAKPASAPEIKPSMPLVTVTPSVPKLPETTPRNTTQNPVPVPVANPKASCEGKVLLAYHSCMLEQCAKPGQANDPACIERMEIEQRSRGRQF